MQDFQTLLTKYLANELTAKEQQAFFDLLREGAHDEALREAIDTSLREAGAANESLALRDSMYARIEAQLQPATPARGAVIPLASKQPLRNRFRQWTVAAILLATLATGAVLWLQRQPHAAGTPIANTRYKNDVAPGSSRATLTLAGGQVIELDSTHTGRLAMQGSTAIVQQTGGEVQYQAAGNKQVAAINTLATPRGGQYKLVLPDGSTVWLNAESSIRFPAGFSGSERTVQLTGEAYFEVVHNPAQPFIVQTSDMQVRALGTSFNVMAYTNENAVKATLVSGAVQAECTAGNLLLKPGQQAAYNPACKRLTAHQVNTDEVTAWKDGFFQFSNKADIQEIMRQLQRWYDIEVVYEGAAPKQVFYGGIERSLSLSKALSILEKTGIRFTIEGRKITVLQTS